jgi:histidyl-tRNA synthetase
LSTTVVESLAQIPDIIIITKTSGDYDLQVTAMIRDISESFAIQDQIARISGITKIEVSSRKIPDKWPTPQQYISTF